MSTPKYLITAAEQDDWNVDNAGVKKDRNPSWCVAFVRFKTPGAMFIGGDDPFLEHRLLVVENDCVSVDIDNSKNSFAKTCSLSMKIGEIFYQNAVSPGDYAFVWVANDQNHIDKVVNSLLGEDKRGSANSNGFASLNDWQSGLKFFGRVMGVSHVDNISAGGQRVLGQMVSCQAFLELASSVYYSFVAQNVLAADGKLSQQAAATNFYSKEIERIGGNKTNNAQPTQPTKSVSNGLEAALTKLSDAFNSFYRKADGKDGTVGDTSPEAIIGLLFIITMGIEAKSSLVNDLIPGASGTFSDAIGIPKSISRILGRKGAKLWQMYNLYLGLQEYEAKGKTAWADFSPKFTSDVRGAVFYRTPTPCKGFVPFLMPPIWDNNSFWNIYNQFLNPIVNEMYTCLRVNKDGKIMPSLVVREKPFSTGLFNFLLRKAPIFQAKTAKDAGGSKATTALKKKLSAGEEHGDAGIQKEYEQIAKTNPDIAKRTLYKNLPRWIISESVLLNISVAPSESNRINFVQVWGRQRQQELGEPKLTPETFKQVQFQIPNYVADEGDIRRHGLRADITETNFDVVASRFGTISHIMCRQRADWLFNGHLKPFGTITLQGVQEPIVEGDNCQVRGVLFHIDSVRHSASLDSGGHKVFRTVLTVSNGIIASSLDTKDSVPLYPTADVGLDHTETLHHRYNLPGFTDIQNTGGRKERDANGEALSVQHDDKKVKG